MSYLYDVSNVHFGKNTFVTEQAKFVIENLLRQIYGNSEIVIE
jgi:hypothetical protein